MLGLKLHIGTFRSTGSYEPDLQRMIEEYITSGFDPQALTSLTFLLPKLSNFIYRFDPQALTSLTSLD